MELAGAIRRALEAASLDVRPEPAGTPTGESCRLRLVLLGDAKGQIQVICRQDDLLDLGRLNQLLGRDLRLLPQAEQVKLQSRTGLAELPALPSLAGWPAVVDQRVRASDRVVLEPVGKGVQVTLDHDQYRALTASAVELAFCVPVQTLNINLDEPERDREQLNSAIQKFTGLRIRQRLEDTLELPPLPETAQRVIHLRVNPHATMGDLVGIVESDPSLAAQVVSWASSSFYASAGQVRSVHDAVSRVLGFDLVMNLAMGLALGKTLKQPGDHPAGFIGYWQQAIWQAQAAGVLTGLMSGKDKPEFGLAYLSGLLHNFGYLVLAHVFPPHFRLACRQWEANPGLDTAVVEQHLLEVTREQIAAELMTNWGMPEEVCLAIRQQKNPGYRGQHQDYAHLLWLGRQLLNERGLQLGPQESIPDDLYQQLGLEPSRVAERMDQLVEARDSVLSMAGMVTSGAD